MFCKNCGREVDTNATFCPGCGTKLQDPVTSITTSNIGTQFTSKAEIDNQYLIQAVGSLLSPLEQIGKTVTRIDRKKIEISNNEKISKMHLDLWLFPFMGIMCIAFILTFFKPSDTVYGLLSCILGIPTGFVVGKYWKNKHIKQSNNTCQNRDQLLQNLNDICETINPEYMHLIPRDYRHFHACQFFYNAFLNGRAMSMQQAVNLYEEELHRSRMEKMQLQQVAQLKSIRTSSAIGAAASSANLFINLFG